MAATQVKFYKFIEELGKGTHDLNGDTLMVYLSNEAPVQATDSTKADIAGITEQNGYQATDIQNAYTQSGGVGTMTAQDVVWTAANGDFGPFRYVVIYNSSKSNKLVSYADYGSEVTVHAGEDFTVDFQASVITIQ